MGRKTKILYHLVISTKYRRKCLLRLEDEVYESVRRAASSGGFRVIEMAVEDGDHLHVVFESRSNFDVASIVSRIKQVTTFDLWNTQAVHLQQYYWKRKRLLWANGYYCASIGDVSTSTVIEYVKKQKGLIHRSG